LALYDGREDSTTYQTVNEFFMGTHSPKLVVIPPGVYHGWKCISDEESVVVNIPTRVYNYDDPDEIRAPYNAEHIPYDWDIKMG
jgi:dTDP-4-dehydrorhamnose 3,5-epimerase